MDNKELITNYFEEVWNKKNFSLLEQFLAHDFRRHISPSFLPLSQEGQKKRMAEIRTALPDIRMELLNIISEGDLVFALILCHATHLGNFMNIPPSGKKVRAYAIEAMRVRDGRIVEHWGGPDTLDLLNQIT
jgi:steroid delta-isomerase-like uncharacterized protein